jgi:hypothetical protein
MSCCVALRVMRFNALLLCVVAVDDGVIVDDDGVVWRRIVQLNYSTVQVRCGTSTVVGTSGWAGCVVLCVIRFDSVGFVCCFWRSDIQGSDKCSIS